ncbi:MAG TPA: hypothetical protein VD927_07680 [Chryseosolibacter sp.]|nr:hypothetical protein [Chryseosolibacter sp.]
MSLTKNFLFTSAAILATAIASRGQEIVFDINHNHNQYDQRIDYERFLSSPGEGDDKHVLKIVSGPKDSLENNAASESIKKPKVVPVTPQKAKTEKPSQTKDVLPKGQKETDESILSFNFLYYIIQKYKLQDIVE